MTIVLDEEYSEEENIPPEVIAEADLIVWGQGSGDPQNPAPSHDGAAHQTIIKSPREARSRSSRAIERIRAVKAAIKNQHHPENARVISPTESSNRKVSGSDPSITTGKDVELSFNNDDFKRVNVELCSASSEENSTMLSQKLHEAVDAMKMLKECTVSLLTEKDEIIKSLSCSSVPKSVDRVDSPFFNKDVSMKDIFDQVMEVLSPSNPNPVAPLQRSNSVVNRRGRKSPRGRTFNRACDAPADVLGATGSTGTCTDTGRDSSRDRDRGRPRRRSASAGSRSISPEGGGRIRRRDTGRSEMLPAPAGGFRRLADMSSNAFLAPAEAGGSSGKGLPGGEAEDAEKDGSMKIKYPLVRPLVKDVLCQDGDGL